MFEDLNPMDKPTAMMEIVIMVVGAALIGFFIGWIIRKLQKDRLRAELRFLQSKHDTLSQKADNTVRDHSDLQRLVDDLRQRKDALFSEVETFKKENQILSEKLEQVDVNAGDSEAVKHLSEQVEKFEQERNSMHQQIRDLESTAKNDAEVIPLKNLIEVLEIEKKDLAAKLETLSNDKSSHDEIERLKGAITASNEEKDQLRSKLNSMSESLPDPGELDKMQSMIDKLQSNNSTLQDKLNSILSDEESKAKITELKEQRSELMRKNRELEEEKHELEEKLEEPVESTIDPKEIADLKLQVAALESEKESLQTALKKRMLETVGPEQISVLEQKVQALERDLEPVVEKRDNGEDPRNGHEQTEILNAEDSSESSDSGNDNEVENEGPAVEPVERMDSSLTYEDYQARKKSLLASVGKAYEADKNNLSEIVGVGPFIEAKLNSIGIYTYEQISRFSDEDVEHVTRLIEFFPGRIERDGWVRQATKLLKKKEEV